VDRRSLGPTVRELIRQLASNSAISKLTTNRVETREFVAIIDTNPATEPLIEPFDYKLQLHVVHGKHN